MQGTTTVAPSSNSPKKGPRHAYTRDFSNCREPRKSEVACHISWQSHATAWSEGWARSLHMADTFAFLRRRSLPSRKAATAAPRCMVLEVSRPPSNIRIILSRPLLHLRTLTSCLLFVDEFLRTGFLSPFTVASSLIAIPPRRRPCQPSLTPTGWAYNFSEFLYSWWNLDEFLL